MSLLIESIKLHDGKFNNLFYHEQRMHGSLKSLCGAHEPFNLESFLIKLNPPAHGLFKCRIVYDEHNMDVEFLPYTPRAIQKLKIVEHDRISYDHKFADRRVIDRLYGLRKECDDVIIVKNKQVTDASYANLAFRQGLTWYTPWSALLKGTMRQSLIEQGVIKEEDITIQDLQNFQAVKLINAMIEFDAPEIPIDNIFK